MKKYIDKFHYLTQDLKAVSHLQQVITACEAGAKWVQYRCFSKSDEEMLRELHEIASVCDDWGTTLIVTAHDHLLAKADIQGVHIENMDADLRAIRKLIGDDKTLGASATNYEQIKKHIKNGADYIGCGPFAHSDTKPNSEKHWGIEGYKEVVNKLKADELAIPLIAAGGITLNDLDELMQTGIHGVAISAAVNKASNPAEAYKEIYRKMKD